MPFRVKWKNLKENIEGLRSFPQVLKEELKTADQESLEKIYDRSQELVPVKTGELKASGRVDLEKGSVIYDAPHAQAVEQDVSAFHDNGQSKFVETAVNELKPEIDKAISSAVEKSFQRIVKK